MQQSKVKSVLVLCFMLMMIIVPGGTTLAQSFSNPSFKAKNAETAKLVKVELTDSYTILKFQVGDRSNLGLHVSSKSYITDSEHNKPLYVKKAEAEYIYHRRVEDNGPLMRVVDSIADINLDKTYYDLGRNFKYIKIYFPRIDKNVQHIDYRAGKDGNFWHYFEIDVTTDIGVDKSVKSGNKGKEGDCRYVDNPGYTAKSGGFNITKIELCEEATILYFKVNNNGWVYIPSKSCIRDSDGGEDLFVVKAEGTKIDERISSDEVPGGVMQYSLYFPPVKKSVKKIDFREINDGGSWFVYELDVDVN